MRTVLIILNVLFASLYTAGQENNLYQPNEGVPRTLVYLQTDKGVYQPGEEIRFKAYVMEARLLVPSVRDTTLYVQLMTADSVIHREKLYIRMITCS